MARSAACAPAKYENQAVLHAIKMADAGAPVNLITRPSHILDSFYMPNG